MVSSWQSLARCRRREDEVLGFDAAEHRPDGERAAGVKRSSAVIHFGNGASSPGFGRPRNLRHARTSSSTPSAIFSRVTAVRGPLNSPASAASVRRSATPPTAARLSSQPPRKAGPFRPGAGRGQLPGSCAIASGLMAMPIAGSISPIVLMVLLQSPREPHSMRSRHSVRRSGVTPSSRVTEFVQQALSRFPDSSGTSVSRTIRHFHP